MGMTVSRKVTYDLTTIDANDEIVPRFNGDFEVLVTEDLEPVGRSVS